MTTIFIALFFFCFIYYSYNRTRNLSEGTKALIKSWENHSEEWTATEQRLSHPDSGIELWIGDGPLHFKSCSGSRWNPNFYEQMVAWEASKKMFEKSIVDSLSE